MKFHQKNMLRKFETWALGLVISLVAISYFLAGHSAVSNTAQVGTSPVVRSVFGIDLFADFKTDNRRPQMVSLASAQLLDQFYKRFGYALPGVRNQQPVPRLFIARLPGDIGDIRSTKKRKELFLRTALPLTLKANEDIAKDRARLQRLQKIADGAGGPGGLGKLNPRQRDWLDRLAKRYGLENPDFTELLRRVDITPPSLALAQAAIESGWGTSRFARIGNALFGQRSFRKASGRPIAGIIPAERAANESYRVRAFASLYDSVRSYAHNLNTHFSYADFRRKRAQMRAAGHTPDGGRLAGTLISYSEEREVYVMALRTLIDGNRMAVLDHARLAGDHVARADYGEFAKLAEGDSR